MSSGTAGVRFIKRRHLLPRMLPRLASHAKIDVGSLMFHDRGFFHISILRFDRGPIFATHTIPLSRRSESLLSSKVIWRERKVGVSDVSPLSCLARFLPSHFRPDISSLGLDP